MSTFKSFEEIEVWKSARALAIKIWQISNTGTFAKDYKLKDQINGSAGSIMDNIAEGYERDGKKEFIQFLSIAKGSAGETRSQIIRAFDRGHINQDEFNNLSFEVVEISKQLSGFMNYLTKSDLKGLKYTIRN